MSCGWLMSRSAVAIASLVRATGTMSEDKSSGNSTALPISSSFILLLLAARSPAVAFTGMPNSRKGFCSISFIGRGVYKNSVERNLCLNVRVSTPSKIQQVIPRR